MMAGRRRGRFDRCYRRPVDRTSDPIDLADPLSEKLGPDVIRIGVVVLIGAFMSILDTTIVNVALDRLTLALHTDFAQIQWIVTGYMLAMAAVIPLSGWITTRFGAKRVFIFSLVTFTLASALCGLSWNLDSLILFRVLQGVGGGLLMPVGQMMLAETAGPRRMGRVMSMVAIPMLVAPVVGPVLGGLLVTKADWEWIFFINVPVGIVGTILAVRMLHDDRGRETWRLDLVGLVLMAIGVPLLTFGLAETGIAGSITTLRAWLPIVLGLALTALYVVYALRRERPLINVRLFRNAAFAAASITAFALGAVLFGGMILLPLYEQGPRMHSALETGLILAPMGLGAAMAAPISGRLADRYGGGRVAVVGLTVLTLATIPFTFLSATTPQWVIMVALFFRGLGVSGSIMPAFAAAYAVLEHRQIPDATSQFNVVQRVGGSIGSAILAVILAGKLGGGNSAPPPEGTVLPMPVREKMADAYASTHWWVVALTLVALVPALVLMRIERKRRYTEVSTHGTGAAVAAPGDGTP